jgi:hypothetical protein
MTPSQLYKKETQNGKLKAEIKEMLASKALSRYEAEELIQLNVLNEIKRPRKIHSSEIKKLKENHNMTSKEKLDTIAHLYINNGFEVVDRDRLEIKLFKKKNFSYLSAFFWFLLLGVGLVIYILYYLLKGNDNVTITVEDNYKVKPDLIEEEIVDTELLEDNIQEDIEELDEIPDEEEAPKEVTENIEENSVQELEESIDETKKTEEQLQSTQTL